MAITTKYFEIIERRTKAIRIRLAEDDRSAVWYPLHRVKIDEDASTITGSDALLTRKKLDAGRDFAAEKKAANDRMIELADADWESEKAIGIDIEIVNVHTDQAARTRVFFPKSQLRDGAAPAWLIAAKESAAIEKYAPNAQVARSLMIEGLRA